MRWQENVPFIRMMKVLTTKIAESEIVGMNEDIVKHVSDSQTEQVHLLFPGSLNSDGRLYGGLLLSWLDETAGIVARRHFGGSVVTASIDRLDFKAGAGNGDTVFIRGFLTYVGNSSMEVRLDTYVEDIKDGKRHMINTAFFVMIGLDSEQKPTRVPRLAVETMSEKAEWEAAEKRQQLRRARRQEGY